MTQKFPLRFTLIALTLAIALPLALLSVTRARAEEDPGPFVSNEFRLNAIEYWGNGSYNGGDGVSFGFRTNDKPWNQACARQAHAELKKALDANHFELKALKDAGGPNGIYIIISDWEGHAPPPLRHGSVWHYAGDEVTQKGGLIKFHAHSAKGPNGENLCNSPTEADLVRFALLKTAAINQATVVAPAPAPAPSAAPSGTPPASAPAFTGGNLKPDPVH